MALMEQLFVNMHPKLFILNDFIYAGPSAPIYVCGMVATQPYVSQPNGKSLSSMIDLVTVELTVLITPFSQAMMGLIQEPDSSGFVVDQGCHQVLFKLHVEVLRCSSEVVVGSLPVLAPLQCGNHQR